jgi:Ni,Fe-hydrogenase I small subunit
MCARNSGIYGNISLFNNTNINRLWIDGTSCTGTIEEFVAAQVAAERTSGTVAVDIHNTSVTYQGRHSKSYTEDLVWENGVITSFPIEFAD